MGVFFNRPTPTVDEIKSFNLADAYDVSVDDEVSFWTTQEQYLIKNMPFSHKRMDMINQKFVSEHTKITVITSRNEAYYSETAKWLHSYGVDFETLIMTNNESKLSYFEWLKPDLVIDDKPELFHEIEEAGMRVDTLCIDYAYNQTVPCTYRMNRDGQVTKQKEELIA